MKFSVGIMVAKNVSDKPDRKEQEMDDGKRKSRSAGCYLTPGERHRFRYCRVMMIGMLLIWDGVLLYMIVKCLIEAVYGAAFVAAISIYLGYQL